MTSGWHIAPTTSADCPALSALARWCFTDTFGHLYETGALHAHLDKSYSPAFFLQSLAEGDFIMLAKNGARLIGYVKAGKLTLPAPAPAPGASELQRLYVLPEYHGQGVAAALMDNVLAFLHPAPEHNTRARRFYTRYGFEVCGTFIYQVGDVIDHDLIMRRQKTA